MQRALALYDTTVGKKLVMAVTGMVLFGFTIGHMLGNLQVYLGPEVLNGYAKKLRLLGPLLWGARGVLLVSVVLHILMAAQVYTRSVQSRGAPRYHHRRANNATNYAALTMWLSGPIIFLFVLYHLAHFTFPGVAMGNYEHSAHDVYSNVVNGFQIPWVVGLYVAAQAALGFHLYHGSWSFMQTLGWNDPRWNKPRTTDRRRRIARAVAVLVVVGNISIPLAVLIGLVR